MADFMRLKYEIPRMNQSQIANQIGLSIVPYKDIEVT